MDSWLAQYCINVTDLDRTVSFYEALGLTCTSRTDIQVAKEAILEEANGKGGKVQLAQQLDNAGPIDMGNAFWKLYVNTNDIDRLYQAALDFGAESVTDRRDPTVGRSPSGSSRIPTDTWWSSSSGIHGSTVTTARTRGSASTAST